MNEDDEHVVSVGGCSFFRKSTKVVYEDLAINRIGIGVAAPRTERENCRQAGLC